MSFTAGFLGSAASAGDSSMRQWRELFMRDALERDRMDIQKEMADDRLEFEERWNQLQHETQVNQWNLEQQLNYAKYFYDRFDTLDPMQQDQIAEWMEESNNPLSNAFRASIRTSIFNNPDSAMAYLDQILSGPGAQRYDMFRVESAARMAGMLGGMRGDDLEDYVQRYVSLAEQRNVGAEEIDENIVEQLRLETRQAAANVRQTEAETNLATQRAEEIVSNMELSAELRPFIVAEAEQRVNLLAEEVIQAQLQSGHMPDALAASLRETEARIRGLDNENELREAIFDATVADIVAQAGISESEARVMVATEQARIDGARATVNETKAAIERLHAETDRIRGLTELDDVQRRAAENDLELAQVSMLRDLVVAGNSEVLESVGYEVLSKFMDPEQARGVADRLAAIAREDKDLATRQTETDIELSASMSEHYTQLAERAALENQDFFTQREHERAVDAANVEIAYGNLAVSQRRVSVEEGYLALARDEFMWKLENQGEGIANPLELLNQIRTATGVSADKMQGTWQDAQDLETDILMLNQFISDGGMDEGEMAALLNRWGITISEGTMTPIEAAQVRDDLERRLGNTRDLMTTQVAQQLRWGLVGGYLFTADQLGIPADVYSRALNSLSLTGEGGTDTEADADVSIRTAIRGLVTNMDTNTWTAGFEGQRTLEWLKDNGYAEDLEVLGITTPSALADYIAFETEQFNIHVQNLDRGTQILGRFGAPSPNLDNASSVDDFITAASAAHEVLGSLRGEVDTADFGTAATVGMRRNRDDALARNAEVTADLMGYFNFNDPSEFSMWAAETYGITNLIVIDGRGQMGVESRKLTALIDAIETDVIRGASSTQQLSTWSR